MRSRSCRFAALAGGFVLTAGLAVAANLSIDPTTFNFGWAPDNSKITADFTVTNIASQMVPLTAVQPTCGCTATSFEPGALASSERTKIGLTFNTRGYTNMAFNKPTQVKTDVTETPYVVYLAGHVTHAGAKLMPEGNGIAQFTPDTKKSTTINLVNKSDKPMTLEVVQEPAGWAKVRSKNATVEPGQSIPVEISVSGSLTETRETSITIAGKADAEEHRVTLAIRTGEAPRPYRQLAPAQSKPAVKPAAAPKTP